MTTYSISDVKAHFSDLIEQVAKGESFVITKAGKPMAMVVPIDEPDDRPKDWIGFMDGEIRVPDDFDTMGADEIRRMFEGE